jgi:hypothetical protein
MDSYAFGSDEELADESNYVTAAAAEDIDSAGDVDT